MDVKFLGFGINDNPFEFLKHLFVPVSVFVWLVRLVLGYQFLVHYNFEGGIFSGEYGTSILRVCIDRCL